MGFEASIKIPITLTPLPSPPSFAECKNTGAWQKFSKVSALLQLLCKVTIDATFENEHTTVSADNPTSDAIMLHTIVSVERVCRVPDDVARGGVLRRSW
jgi:hypothetical protein